MKKNLNTLTRKKNCLSSLQCQCFDHSFLFLPRNPPAISRPPPFSKICTLLHIVGFVILWRSPALPSALLIIFSTFRWCISSIFSFSSFFFKCSSHLYHFCMVSSHPVWIHASSQSFASNSETHQRFLASFHTWLSKSDRSSSHCLSLAFVEVRMQAPCGALISSSETHSTYKEQYALHLWLESRTVTIIDIHLRLASRISLSWSTRSIRFDLFCSIFRRGPCPHV